MNAQISSFFVSFLILDDDTRACTRVSTSSCINIHTLTFSLLLRVIKASGSCNHVQQNNACMDTHLQVTSSLTFYSSTHKLTEASQQPWLRRTWACRPWPRPASRAPQPAPAAPSLCSKGISVFSRCPTRRFNCVSSQK